MEQLNVDNPNSFNKLPIKVQCYFYKTHNLSLLKLVEVKTIEINRLKFDLVAAKDQVAKFNIESVPFYKQQITFLKSEIDKVKFFLESKANECEIMTRYLHEKGLKKSFNDFKSSIQK